MKFPAPPRGFKAIPWRLPIWIYRLGFGFIIGRHGLLLTHKGRKSGKDRQNVLEIIHSSPNAGKYYVVSGFGTRSDWYKNIINDPSVTIQIGNKKMAAVASQLNPEEASQLILAYTQKYPKNLKTLGAMIGYDIEHTPEGYRAFGKEIPVICLSTTTPE